MNHDNHIITSKNADVEIRDLILTLWQNKWLIINLMSIFFVLGLAYVIFFQSKTAIYFVKPVSSFELEQYSELNELLKQIEMADLTLGQRDNSIGENNNYIINAQFLLNLLMERVTSRKDFISAVKQLEIIPKGNKSEDEWKQKINEFVYGIEFVRPLTQDELLKNKSIPPRLYWSIETQSVKNEMQYKMLLETSLKIANEFVRTSLNNRIKQVVEEFEKRKQHKIEDIDIQIKNLRDDYMAKVSNRIVYLKEQAQIARKLGISIGSIGTTDNLNMSVLNESPFYMRGYLAIEEELFLLENRDTVDEYIPEILDLAYKRRAIIENRIVSRLEKALENSTIQKTELFHAATFDVDNIKYIILPNPILVLIIAIFLGGIIGSVFVVFRKMVKAN